MRQSAAPGLDQQGIDVPVIAAFKLDDLVSTSKTTGEPDAAHGGLGAAVDHAHFFHQGTRSQIVCAISTSNGFGIPKLRPLEAAPQTAAITASGAWPRMAGPHVPT
jgi:hypothetical protein